ncbi:acyl-CoA dehydrogenase family protein [Streptomyces sp. TRM 70351]|uniref:L-prolyl-[peptidyl-carrier protein] dehydrogenase n=1 Tax=Streptomyces sp. TRM 70351 TaxID=3116552 RepID=UPI002E7BB457|nr:L-prolyl-[peptidyl-carrier protein] dehydrogenase [Streptomyces sp. TRM 70351]MEE1928872.1 acyl-CoA dehydrogenase family protein [Streptomyces sp. TRM 70351]
MNFEFDAQTDQMCATIADFARNRLAGPDAFEPDGFRRRWRLVGEQGALGTVVPSAYGGLGQGAVTAAAIMEALGYGCMDTGFVFSLGAHVFACLTPIVEFGTEEQKQRWLPLLCSGKRIAAHCITEPEAGSDALSMRTRAERRGDAYVLNGDKSFTTNSPVADVFIVQTATRPGGGCFGLTSFVVEAGTPGLTVGKRYEKVGLDGSPTADVHFDDCTVPASQMLGPEGGGFGVFRTSMAWERTCLFALYLGTMRRVLETSIAYANERQQFGTAIGGFQAVSHRIVDMAVRLETARLMLYRAAWGLDRGSTDEVAPALAKLAVSEAAVQAGLDAVQIQGGLGVLHGQAETALRDALPARIFSGTNEIQKNNIARALGLGGRSPRSRA